MSCRWAFLPALALLCGCYPYQADHFDEVEVRLPVGWLGAVEDDFDGMRQCLQRRQDGLDATFDFGEPRSNFYLGLAFTSASGPSQPVVSGISVLELTKDVGGAVTDLAVMVQVGPCPECRVEGTVFWSQDAQMVRTFSGTAPCSVESGACSLVLDEQPIGTVLAHAQGDRTGLVLAAWDAVETVRFPRAAELPGAAGNYRLDAIPIGRSFHLQMAAGGGFADVAEFILTSEGEQRTLDFVPAGG